MQGTESLRTIGELINELLPKYLQDNWTRTDLADLATTDEVRQAESNLTREESSRRSSLLMR